MDEGHGGGRFFYWRQLRDMKGSTDIESMGLRPSRSTRACAVDARRAHARSGDPIAIAAYLGKKDAFDRSITDFSGGTQTKTSQDYQAFTKAISTGRLTAIEGV